MCGGIYLRCAAALLFCWTALAWPSTLDVPFVRQQKQGCGAAAVAMLMQYWADHGARVSPRAADAATVYRLLYDPRVQGTAGSSIVAYLHDQSFAAFPISGSRGDLTTNL